MNALQHRAALLIAVLALALGACGKRAVECPVRCGDRCLAVSACGDIVCPADSPCDPCSGQCRLRCDEATPCVDPQDTCCGGSCVDTQSSKVACGGCNTSCGADADRCVGGACGCGTGAACGKGSLCCGGACIAANGRNCGACGLSCGDGEVCDLSAGGCRCGTMLVVGPACAAGQACCGSSCIDVQADAFNCGACGQSCGPGVACKTGRCDCSMSGCLNPAQSCCEGGCVTTATDEADCGACGIKCGASELCTGSQCTCNTAVKSGGPACATGSACCPGGCFDLTSHAANCGVCGRTCDMNTTSGCSLSKCVCKPGYTPSLSDPTRCVDINECLTNNGGCLAGAVCTNTAGSRICACAPGYAGDGITSCTDVNECLTGNGGCSIHASCTNTPGSRTCMCIAGWMGDGVTCTDINECATNNGGCSVYASCTNTPGSRTCACNAPRYTGDGITCTCVPITCDDVPYRAGVVRQCPFSGRNDQTLVEYGNLCGGTISCGDCCHSGGYCGGGTSCVHYDCSCPDTGQQNLCEALGRTWQGPMGTNCCAYSTGVACTMDNQCG